MLSPQQTLDTYYLEARCDLLEQLGFTPSPQNDLMPNINKTGIMPIKVREEGWTIIDGKRQLHSSATLSQQTDLVPISHSLLP